MKVVSLLNNKEGEMTALCSYLQLRPISDEEKVFLNEFVKAMAPLAMSLDVIQRQDHVCAGYLIPTLRSMLDEWCQMNDMVYTTGLIGKQ